MLLKHCGLLELHGTLFSFVFVKFDHSVHFKIWESTKTAQGVDKGKDNAGFCTRPNFYRAMTFKMAAEQSNCTNT